MLSDYFYDYAAQIKGQDIFIWADNEILDFTSNKKSKEVILHNFEKIQHRGPDKTIYYFDNNAIKEEAIYAGDDRGSRGDSRRGTDYNSMSGKTGETKNKRDVWTVPVRPYAGAHFAGANGVKAFLTNNSQTGTVDGFGTSLKKYMSYFSNFHLPPVRG